MVRNVLEPLLTTRTLGLLFEFDFYSLIGRTKMCTLPLPGFGPKRPKPSLALG